MANCQRARSSVFIGAASLCTAGRARISGNPQGRAARFASRRPPGGIRLTDTDTWSEPRRRGVEWHDPRPAAELGATLSGREYMQLIADGTLPPPPIAATLGFDITRIGDGEVWFTS